MGQKKNDLSCFEESSPRQTFWCGYDTPMTPRLSARHDLVFEKQLLGNRDFWSHDPQKVKVFFVSGCSQKSELQCTMVDWSLSGRHRVLLGTFLRNFHFLESKKISFCLINPLGVVDRKVPMAVLDTLDYRLSRPYIVIRRQSRNWLQNRLPKLTIFEIQYIYLCFSVILANSIIFLEKGSMSLKIG